VTTSLKISSAALIMPACNTEAMNLHLAEIAATVAPAAHAILLVDQAEEDRANLSMRCTSRSLC
jgi:hypothetical protein